MVEGYPYLKLHELLYRSISQQTVPVQSNYSYKLYLYGEGAYYERVKNLNVDGVPIIFVPGHGGSYKQARSIGSVLLRKSFGRNSNHFNVFAIDFNEEFVGISGKTLQAQVEFLRSSINAILTLYQPPQPSSVVLVAHSIGGVIARGLFLLDLFDVSSISVILTFATPNLTPVVSVDYEMARFYKDVNDFWKSNAGKLSNISVLSVSGGDNDLQVRHYLTRLPTQQNNHLSTSLNAISRVQLTTDHQAIVWCRQMVLVTSRFLYSLLDRRTGQVTENAGKRNQLMNYYFGSRQQAILYSLNQDSKVKLNAAYAWKTITEMRWTRDGDCTDSGIYYNFNVIHYLEQNGTDFAAEISMSKNRKWIFVCGENCSKAVDLSKHSITNGNMQRLRLKLNLLHKEGFSHVLISILKNSKAKHIAVNVATQDEFEDVSVPSVFSNLWTLGKGYNYLLDSQAQFYHRVRLIGFSSIYQNFNVSVNDSQANLEFEPSWDPGMASNGSDKLRIKLGSTPSDGDCVILYVYTDAANPTLYVSTDFVSSLSQLCQHFYGCLLVLVLANLLLTYSFLVRQLIQCGSGPHQLKDVHFKAAKPYKIVPFVSLIHFLFQYDWFATPWRSIGLPLPDTVVLQTEHRIWFDLCPLIFFFFAYEFFAFQLMFQRGLNFLLTGGMKCLTINFYRYISNAKYWRILFHVGILSVLIPINCALVFFYIFVTSVLSSCYMTLIEEAQNKKDSDKTLQATKSLRVVTSLIWFWLFLCNLPSLIFAIMRPIYSSESNVVFYQTIVASVVFLLQSIADSDTIKRGLLTTFHIPTTVLIVSTCLYSFHRAPGFLLLFMIMHILSTL